MVRQVMLYGKLKVPDIASAIGSPEAHCESVLPHHQIRPDVQMEKNWSNS